MRKKLSFVAAVLHRPPVLLCDEALEGFDAGGAMAAKAELVELASGGCAGCGVPAAGSAAEEATAAARHTRGGQRGPLVSVLTEPGRRPAVHRPPLGCGARPASQGLVGSA